MRRRFFVERFEGAAAVLRGDSAHHLGHVLRARPGQLYELSDRQRVWLGRIERMGREAIEFVLVEPVAACEPSLRVVVLLSIVKFDRFEWCLEKATELGAAEVVPLAAARSDAALIAAAAKRAQRWRRILRESAEQARRLRPPIVCPVARPKEAFRQVQAACKIVLSERQQAPLLRPVLSQAGRTGRGDIGGRRGIHPEPVTAGRGSTDVNGRRPEGASAPEALSASVWSVALAIGPEGGWTDAELAAACAAGFAEASLGSSILRTETAVLAALAVVNYALGE